MRQDGSILGMCSVTCNPAAPDNGCPRGWNCGRYYATCLQDADCNNLPCVGANTGVNPPVRGKCQCGDNNTPNATCPTTYNDPGLPDAVANPRCVAEPDGRMFCLASYMCSPVPVREMPMGSGIFNYPPVCLQ